MTKFAQGVSGNPGGRPKKNDELIQAARDKTVIALDTLASIMANKQAPAAARVAAAREILDRGWGRPTQDVRVEAELTATVNTQAFIRPSTYAEWLELRARTTLAKENAGAERATENRVDPLLLADARPNSVGDYVGE
jgi:hypothetical protein